MLDLDKVEKRRPWEDQEIITARSILTKAKFEYQHCRTPENKTAAAASAKALSDLYISKENQYYNNLSDELMKLSGDHQHAAAWKQINIITGRKARSQYVINAESKEEETKLWIVHFKQLLSPGATPNIKKDLHPNILPNIKLDYNVELFTLSELKSATKSMSDGKAAGVDELINEVLKLEEFQKKNSQTTIKGELTPAADVLTQWRYYLPPSEQLDPPLSRQGRRCHSDQGS